MTLTHPVFLLLLGLAVGILSGLLGIGGGVIIIPALVFLFGLSQHQAQGTSLAVLVPATTILAAWTYYRQGHVNLKTVGLVWLGVFFGGLLGAKIATSLSSVVLTRMFGVALLLISLRMIFTR